MRRDLQLLLPLAAWAALAARLWFVCDDAFVPFRYARSWIEGRGWTFGPGDPAPVQGFSNPLWALLSAAVMAVGGEPPAVLPWVSATCAALVLAWTWWRADRAPGAALGAVLPLAVAPPLAAWSSSGLETAAFTLAAVLWFDALVLSRDLRLAAVAGPALVWLRDDGALFAAAYAALALVGGPDRTPARRVVTASLPAIAAAVALLAWRWTTFGALVPHVAAVKVAPSAAILARGAAYVADVVVSGVAPIAWMAALPLLARRGGRHLAVAGAALVPVVPALAAGGDFLPFGRLLVAGLPFATLALADGLARLPVRARIPIGVLLAGVGVLPAFGRSASPVVVPRPRRPEVRQDTDLGVWSQVVRNQRELALRGRLLAEVAEPGDAVVAAAVGTLGYVARDLVILDTCGLVAELPPATPTADPFSRLPGHDRQVDPTFFAPRSPRFLYARASSGPAAARELSEVLGRWSVPPGLRDRYVPDLHVDGADALLVVRLVEPGEDAAASWAAIPRRLRALGD